MHSFASMLNDDVVIESVATGERHGPFKTAFGTNSKKGISIFDQSLDVVEGDKAIRVLPNGREERYTITEVSFSSGIGGIGGIEPHYTLALSKDTAFSKAPPVSSTTNHISIHHSQGIQIGDHNIQNLQLALGEILKSIDDSGAPREQREEAKSRLTEFLAHPLVAAVVGAGLPAALGLLS